MNLPAQPMKARLPRHAVSLYLLCLRGQAELRVERESTVPTLTLLGDNICNFPESRQELLNAHFDVTHYFYNDRSFLMIAKL